MSQAVVPDPKWMCPDRPRRKVDMSRLSCVQNFSCALRAFEGKYVQTIPDRNGICPDFRAFFSRPSCAPNQIRAFNAKIFVRPCPDFRAVIRPSCVHVQTIVRSCPDHRAFIRVSRPCKFERTTLPSCVHFCLDISGFGLGPQPGVSLKSNAFRFSKNLTHSCSSIE